MPPAWQLIGVLLATLVAVTVLTAIPSRLGARHSPAQVLQTDQHQPSLNAHIPTAARAYEPSRTTVMIHSPVTVGRTSGTLPGSSKFDLVQVLLAPIRVELHGQVYGVSRH